MKPIYFVLLYAAVLAGCASGGGQQTLNTISEKVPVSDTASKGTVYVKDSSQYDTAFINGLVWNEPIKLVDSLCIVGDDTVHFPTDLVLNSATVFKGATPGKHFVLTVKRTNLTNLSYTVVVIDKSTNAADSLRGKAVLKSSFFLASEVDHDPEEEAGFGSSEYLGNEGGCEVVIRVGIGPDERGRKRATIYTSCPSGGKQQVSLDDSPILRTE